MLRTFDRSTWRRNWRQFRYRALVPRRPHGRSRDQWRSRVLVPLYGRALYLPPVRTSAQRRAPDDALTRGLRPFQRRLYRQRIVVGLLRTLAAAIVVAIGLMLLRVFGVALPMPLPMPMLVAPLAGAGVVLLAGLVALLRQRPDPARMAHALDRCLGLREQIGSALEVSDDEARQSNMAARLRLRAEATLRDVPPTRVLPWPSMRWETRSVVGLALLASGATLLAAHAPNPGNPNGQQLAASRDRARTGSVARPARANPALGRPPGALIGVISLGNATVARPGQGVLPGARRLAAGSPQSLQSGNGRGGATTRIVAGKALTHSGANANGSAGQAGQNGAGGNRNGPGNASTSGGQGNGGNQGSGASANGRRAGNGHGAGSRQGSGNGTGGQGGAGLQPGQNKGSGGVMNPQQQALANLQNSISSAQQQGQGGNPAQGGSQGGAQGQMQGQNGRAGAGQSGTGNGAQGRQGQGQNTAGGSRGRQGQGQGQGQGSGRNTTPGNGAGGTGQGGGTGAGQGRASPGSRRIGSTNGGYDGYGGRFGQYGPDSGANGGDSQGASGSPAQTNRQGPARLADGSGVVLNGTQGGPQGNTGLILTVGLPQQAPGAGSSAPTDTNSTTAAVPGYVAPDSNAVAPDERDVVRAYFSPHDSN